VAQADAAEAPEGDVVWRIDSNGTHYAVVSGAMVTICEAQRMAAVRVELPWPGSADEAKATAVAFAMRVRG